MTGEPSNLALRRVAFAIRAAREAIPASQTNQLSAHRHRPQAAKRMAQHCRGPRHQQPRSTDGAKDTSTRSQMRPARQICPTRPLAPPTRRPLAPISTEHLQRRPTRTPLADITPPPSATMESFERSRLGSIEPASTNHSSHRDPTPCFDDDIATKVELLGADQARALLRHFACGNDALARAILAAPMGDATQRSGMSYRHSLETRSSNSVSAHHRCVGIAERRRFVDHNLRTARHRRPICERANAPAWN